MTIFSDHSLAQKIERTEGRANAAFVTARARLNPSSGATWCDIGGTLAMFDGPDSQMTQTFGLGLFDEITPALMARLEDFFLTRQAPVLHEVSPLAAPELTPLLNGRGYQPLEYTSVLVCPLNPDKSLVINNLPRGSDAPQLVPRLAEASEIDLWAETSARGWSAEMPDYYEFIRALGCISAQAAGAVPFFAELRGKPISAAMLFMYDDVALLAGASTMPEARRQGAQSALLAARLRHATAHGCTLAIMGARPGSQSQRNAEKNGFRVAYTRVKWQLRNVEERITEA